MLPWRRIEFTLFSPHSPAECAVRVGSLTVPFSHFGLMAFLSDKPLFGDVSAEPLWLQRRNDIQSPLRPHLFATLEPAGEGTRLECEVRLPRVSSALVTLAASVFLSCGFCCPLWQLVNGPPGNASLYGLGGLSVFFVLWFAAASQLAAGEPEFLERTLANCLGAHRWGEPPMP